MQTYRVDNAEFIEWAGRYCGPKFHACFCDPPYGLEFMGKQWDAPHKASSFPKPGNIGGFADGNKPPFARQGCFMKQYQEWVESWATALIPLLHPGAMVFCFGGTRTWHRLASGLEDAGFEMWDTLMWLHGQGFPKAQAIDKLIDKRNGDARKIVSQGSPIKRMIPGSDQNKTGSWIKDNGREYCSTESLPGSEESSAWSGYKTCALKPAWEPVLCFRAPDGGRTYAELATETGSGCLNVEGGRIATDGRPYRLPLPGPAVTCYGDGIHGSKAFGETNVGRYPANLALDEESAEALDEQSGTLTSGANPSQRFSGKTRNVFGAFQGREYNPVRGADAGGSSRFFYTAKASPSERHSQGTVRNTHPTVKPLALCRWLATLLLPPESVGTRRLLVPFSGSGSEMIGALQAGWDEVVGIDQDAEYCKTAVQRIEHHVGLLARAI